jgi:hypothetical protein
VKYPSIPRHVKARKNVTIKKPVRIRRIDVLV